MDTKTGKASRRRRVKLPLRLGSHSLSDAFDCEQISQKVPWQTQLFNADTLYKSKPTFVRHEANQPVFVDNGSDYSWTDIMTDSSDSDTYASSTPSLTLSSHSDTTELDNYREILSNNTTSKGGNGGPLAEERNAPLLWYNTKEYLDQQQYAVLGHVPNSPANDSHPEPVLLNTNAPWSAFLCGSQGSGKSHALSCILENCILNDPSIGKNPNPLAGLVFHYDRTQSMDVCEAAYLCSSVKTRVLVSPSNYAKMKARYEQLARKTGGSVEVMRLLLVPNRHLDVERIKTLMAAGKEGELPLYMHVSFLSLPSPLPSAMNLES